MSKFHTRLSIISMDDRDNGQWVLLEPLHYQSDIAKMVIIVPRGTVTDFASTPRLPVIYLLAGNVATMAAVVHDHLYQTGMLSRKMADAVFREASEASGVSWFRRWTMWAGVRLGGSSHYSEAD